MVRSNEAAITICMCIKQEKVEQQIRSKNTNVFLKMKKDANVQQYSSNRIWRPCLLRIFIPRHGILLVLVLSNQVPDVLIRLLELHLVHALALIPVQERLALVHGPELGRQALE